MRQVECHRPFILQHLQLLAPPAPYPLSAAILPVLRHPAPIQQCLVILIDPGHPGGESSSAESNNSGNFDACYARSNTSQGTRTFFFAILLLQCITSLWLLVWSMPYTIFLLNIHLKTILAEYLDFVSLPDIVPLYPHLHSTHIAA